MHVISLRLHLRHRGAKTRGTKKAGIGDFLGKLTSKNKRKDLISLRFSCGAFAQRTLMEVSVSEKQPCISVRTAPDPYSRANYVAAATRLALAAVAFGKEEWDLENEPQQLNGDNYRDVVTSQRTTAEASTTKKQTGGLRPP